MTPERAAHVLHELWRALHDDRAMVWAVENPAFDQIIADAWNSSANLGDMIRLTSARHKPNIWWTGYEQVVSVDFYAYNQPVRLHFNKNPITREQVIRVVRSAIKTPTLGELVEMYRQQPTE